MDQSEIPRVTGTPSEWPRMMYKAGERPTTAANESVMATMLKNGWEKKRPAAPPAPEVAAVAPDSDRLANLERRVADLEARTAGPSFPTTAGKKFQEKPSN